MLLCIVAPFFLVVGLIILIDSGRPVFFRQKRMGKDKEPFWIWKFRTMVNRAVELQSKYIKINEADGPVFKIRNDPRFTRFGRWLSWSGLDELPQLINVLKGEMTIVGPRPLPIKEALKVAQNYQKRFSVLPGTTSSWVIKGAHNLSFKEWMKLDMQDVEKNSLGKDFAIMLKTVKIIFLSIYKMLDPKKIYLLMLLAIIIGGGIIRYIRIVQEIVWNDEIFYLSVARNEGLWAIITSSHWIIDHPPLYLLFVHFWSLVSTSSIWLRIPNIFFYLGSSLVLLKIGEQLFRQKFTRLVLSGIYAFFPYFVGIDWQAIPYSLTFLFFLGSFYHYLRIPDDKVGNKHSIYGALYLGLFFYTSFEAGYFALSIFVYNLVNFGRYPSWLKAKYIKFYVIALLLVSPELYILYKNFPQFPELSTHWEQWKWGVIPFFKDVFGIKSMGVAFSNLVWPALCVLYFGTKEKKFYSEKIILLLSILGGFGIILYLISTFFFYASHPKAYYYVLVVMFMLMLLCLEWSFKKYRKITLIALFLIVQSSVWWFYPTRNWLQADYLHTSDKPNPIVIRENLNKILLDNPNMKLITDFQTLKGEWIKSAYLNYYYLGCMDKLDEIDCSLIAKAKLNVKNTMDNDESTYIAILFDAEARKFYEENWCKESKKCLSWDFEENMFVEKGRE